jgi:nucleotide-binding universal stress UspA family protein
MYPFRNILFTTDFSANSKSALKYAAAFAHEHGATIYIHNAQEGTLPPQALKLSDRALAEHGYDWVMAVKKEIEELAASELLNGLKVQMIVSEGRAVDEIPRVIRDYNIDLATMGTTARSGLGGGIGSTALTVMGRAGCPVLFTRHAQHDFVYFKGAQTSFALNRILLATDFSEQMTGARELAIALAREHKAQLTILHAIGSFLTYINAISGGDIYNVVERVRKDAQDLLNQIASQAQGVDTETLICEGRAYDEVLRVATDKDMELIVLGAGQHQATSSMPGRAAERIVRGAPCPVLTVRNGTAI